MKMSLRLYTVANYSIIIILYTAGVPQDGTPMKIVTTFHMELVIILDILAIVGIVFSFACLLFNIIFRNRR